MIKYQTFSITGTFKLMELAPNISVVFLNKRELVGTRAAFDKTVLSMMALMGRIMSTSVLMCVVAKKRVETT